MSFDDYFKRFGYKSPPPQKHLGHLGRLALDLKGFCFTFGFVWGLLVFMASEEYAFDVFLNVWGLVSVIAMFSDTYPKPSRAAILVASICTFVILIWLFIADEAQGWATALTTAYVIVVSGVTLYQCKKLGYF